MTIEEFRNICDTHSCEHCPISETCKFNCPIYLCDPEKNINCTKESCYINSGPCSSTTKPEFAFTNESGEPIKEDYKEEEE